MSGIVVVVAGRCARSDRGVWREDWKEEEEAPEEEEEGLRAWENALVGGCSGRGEQRSECWSAVGRHDAGGARWTGVAEEGEVEKGLGKRKVLEREREGLSGLWLGWTGG